MILYSPCNLHRAHVIVMTAETDLVDSLLCMLLFKVKSPYQIFYRTMSTTVAPRRA